jgi:hypothetical protein
MSPRKLRITKEETLSFLLTHIIIELGLTLQLDQLHLFNLSNLAQQAATQINDSDGVIPHEIIEELAKEYLESI